MTFDLPWPPSILSPNARAHWAKKAPVATSYKLACYMLTKGALAGAAVPHDGVGKVACTLTFYPPDNRRRDDDNAIAAFKSGRDGMCAALGFDDQFLRPSYHFGEPVKGGAVRVTFA